MKRFGITMGDPAGVGPEVTLKLLSRRPDLLERCVVFGGGDVLSFYNEKFRCGMDVNVISRPEDGAAGKLNVIDPAPLAMADFDVGRMSPVCGERAFRYVEAAIGAAMAGEIAAVVTAPLNKAAMRRAGHMYDGHTEIFKELTGAKTCAMMLWSEKLSVIHCTTHMALRDVGERLTEKRVAEVVEMADGAMRRMGVKNPRVAVAGLNPHAGENGAFGTEEAEKITPAVEKCREGGINVAGPLPPDTVFLRAAEGEFDIVVAMYHDQGHIPMKMLDFRGGVNITVGLPIVRTSVDHGTAFDIAGTWAADDYSLQQAVKAADMLTMGET